MASPESWRYLGFQVNICLVVAEWCLCEGHKISGRYI